MIYTYCERDALLLKLGFESYDAYLASDLWKLIKEACREILGRSCSICGRPYRAFHHLSYDEPVLLGEDLFKLTPLCVKCHHAVEFNGKHKRNLRDVQLTYNRLKAGTDVRAYKKRGYGLPKNKKRRCLVCGNRAVKKTTLCRPCKKSV